MLSSEDCPICDDEVTLGTCTTTPARRATRRTEATFAILFPNTGDTVDFGGDIRVHPKLTDPDSYRDASVAPRAVTWCLAPRAPRWPSRQRRGRLGRAASCAALDDGDIGDEPEELGDALLYAHITTREDVAALAAMHETHCALLEDGDALLGAARRR